MAAACSKLGTSLGVGHWRAALDNVVHLQHRIVSARAESEMVGLEIGSPAVLFKQELGEAINQAALAGGVSYLNKEDRQIAPEPGRRESRPAKHKDDKNDTTQQPEQKQERNYSQTDNHLILASAHRGPCLNGVNACGLPVGSVTTYRRFV